MKKLLVILSAASIMGSMPVHAGPTKGQAAIIGALVGTGITYWVTRPKTPEQPAPQPVAQQVVQPQQPQIIMVQPGSNGLGGQPGRVCETFRQYDNGGVISSRTVCHYN